MKKKVTMKDIGDALELSVNAVSLALNGKSGVSESTRREVLHMADKLGYIDFAARYDKAFCSTCICIIIKKKYYNSSFYTKVMYGLETEAKQCGYNIVVQFYEENTEVPDCILKQKVCGVIIAGQFDEDYIRMIYETRLPVILVDHSAYRLPIECILTDNKTGVLESVSYLIRAGYRKIGFFGEYAYSNSNKERFDGYLEAMQKLEPDFKKLFAMICRYSVLEGTEELVLKRDRQGVVRLLEQMEELPEVFQCSNDRNAVLLNNALQFLGYRVPEDIGIVGFDDGDLAAVMCPPLTTVHVSTVRMGQKAFERLMWCLDHREATQEKIMMQVSLKIRESTRTIKE